MSKKDLDQQRREETLGNGFAGHPSMGDIALWDAVSIVVGEKVCFFQGFRGDFMCDHKTTMCCRLSIFLSMLKRYVSESVIDSSTPQKRRPPGIRLGIPALQHLHLWPANHRLQKVCICWRPSSHTCWWRLAGSGRGGEQAHGNRWWIRPDLEVKAQHYRVSAVFHLNNKEAKRELKVNLNNKTLPFCSEPKYLGVTLDRSLTCRRHLESLRKKLTSRVALLRRLAGSGWSAWATT